MKKILAMLLALSMVLAMAACGSKPSDNNGKNDDSVIGGADSPTDIVVGEDGKEPELPEVTANYSEYILTEVGTSFQLLPVGVEGIYAATYTSSDDSVAAVDETGTVRYIGPGQATIAMHIEGNGSQYDFTCAVTCAQQPGGFEGPVLNRTDFTLKNVGDTFRLEIMDLPEGADKGAWTISDEKVATIAEDGTVTAVGGGKATASIVLDLGGDEVTLTCIVRCSAIAAEKPQEDNGGNESTESADVPTLTDFLATVSETYGLKMLGSIEGEVLDNYYAGLSGVSTKQCLVQESMMTMANCAVSLVEVSNSGDVQTVKDILSARAKAQADGGAWYPDSCETWKNAVIVSTGNYVGMFVSPDNAQAMADLFTSTYGG